MNAVLKVMRTIVPALIAALCVLAFSSSAWADKIHLKDGRVLEGKVVQEGDGWVQFTIIVGKIESTQTYTTGEYTKIERDSTPADVRKPAATAAKKDSSARTGKATRVAILNFGPPSNWQGAVDNTVGIQVAESAWRAAIPMLEKDNVDVVIVRINSGGGLALEVPKFNKLYQEEYKPRFRTVAWVESAISAAAMSPYVLEEMYFMPEGNLGACTAFSGALNAVKGAELEVYLAMMEEASRMGGRDSLIMRAMQIQQPLSATVDPATGEVKFFGDTSGEIILNPDGQVLTLNAMEAVKVKFARGIAATPEELVKVMGLQEVEWAGQAATDYIDQSMRDNDRTEKRLGEIIQKYAMAVQFAQGAQDRQQRAAQVGRAQRYLNEMRRWFKMNPNFELLYGFDDAWFEAQERMLKDLLR